MNWSKALLFMFLTLTAFSFIFLKKFWGKVQPVEVEAVALKNDTLAPIPELNRQIIEYVEQNGRNIAPDYEQVVCTEFVIKVIEHFKPLTKKERNEIRIITNENLSELIKNNSPVIKGVQTAFVNSKKGIAIENLEDVLPGDFVQFWNGLAGWQWGHCGIVQSLNLNSRKMTLYSSHPVTDGYGVHEFNMPDKVFFVRLK